MVSYVLIQILGGVMPLPFRLLQLAHLVRVLWGSFGCLIYLTTNGVPFRVQS
jgi:hypothetical protein